MALDRDKVLVYITHGRRLLLLAHPDDPQAGVQAPGGTIDPGESPWTAALREACEETGLTGLELRAYLGARDLDLRPYGGRIVQRHFFHLVLRQQPPETWRHYEYHPSDGSPAPIAFDFYWARFPEDVPELAGGQGELLHLVRPRDREDDDEATLD